MHDIIKKHPIMAILRHTPMGDLAAYTDSLYKGGIRSFEVSFSTKNAVEQLSFMKKHMPGDAYIGAGTILTIKEAESAISAGADFLLSPATNPDILKYCRDNQIPLLPGVFSPTDVSVCLSYGFHTLKLFPAGELPMNYLKGLKGPFPTTEYVAVGGISPEQTPMYLKAGFAGVGIGSSLVDKQLFETKSWTQITKNIHDFIGLLREESLL